MSSKPLSEFTKLDDLVSIYHPDTSKGDDAARSAPQGPELIIFCSWMGAATKHLAKYITGYKHLFPNASILLIQSTMYSMFAGTDISPAYEAIQSFQKDDTHNSNEGSRTGMVLHAFSNGGANNAVLLANALLENQKSLQLDRLVLDCCPGKPEIEAGARAMTLSLPNQPLVRTVGFYLIYLSMCVFALISQLLRLEDTISWIRRSLNDEKLFSRATPRLYVYSKGDTMVGFEDVHEHAEDARQADYEGVREVVFEKALHCALLNEDSERYWKEVGGHISG